MKRTPMRRTGWNKQPKEADTHTDQAPVAIKTIAKIQQKPVGSMAMSAPILKSAPVRDEGYRRRVAALPCIICGVEGYSQAAHGSDGKGMAIKASDLNLFPACCDRPGVRGCHGQLDQGAMFSKAERKSLEPIWAEQTAIQLGKIK